MTATYYRTKVTIEVLSESEIGDMDLMAIAVECDAGAFVGAHLTLEPKQLTPSEAAKALKEFGSEPEFFNLDDDGKPLDEEEAS